jgi:hypothetical protein
VTFEVVGGGYPVPDPTSGRILSEVLAKFWEFCSHIFFLIARSDPD